VPAQGYISLSDDQQQRAKSMLAQTQPLSKLSEIPKWTTSLENFTLRCGELLNTSVGEIAIEDLRGHDAMREWLSKGLKYHEENKLPKCLFCANDLSKMRRQDLASLFNSAYERLMRDFNDFRLALQEAERRYQNVESILPRAFDFGVSRQAAAGNLIFAAKSAAAAGVQVLVSLRELVDEKLRSPNLIFRGECLPAIKNTRALDESIDGEIEKLRRLADEHNTEVDEFDRAKANAANSLKGHLLAEGKRRIRATRKRRFKSQETNFEVGTRLNSLREEAERVKGVTPFTRARCITHPCSHSQLPRQKGT
jgi:wobble nucleotide-excising tRNase